MLGLLRIAAKIASPTFLALQQGTAGLPPSLSEEEVLAPDGLSVGSPLKLLRRGAWRRAGWLTKTEGSLISLIYLEMDLKSLSCSFCQKRSGLGARSLRFA